MQVNSHMDPQLVDKIVHEVKSQGVFDEFRKDSMADVDTKPAYQNLRQRVETTVKKFLSEQKWSPEMNKNQLRERLRKHITDAGFLDLGVERIVDQVVNPKIASVFQPKIEDIAYKYLGIPKPQHVDPFPILHQMQPFPVNGSSLKIETSELLPTDLEQVSPDSDKATVKSECKDESISMDLEEKPDDDEESPPFEPLVQDDQSTKTENTSQDNVAKVKAKETACEEIKVSTTIKNDLDEKAELDLETLDTSLVSLKTEEPESEKIDQLPDRFQESQSQLSQVSSNSRLSVDTHDNNNVSLEFNSKSHDNAVNISEEAQMPKFNENSNDDHIAKGEANDLHFDINQDEIKFEGTKRKGNLQPTDFSLIAPDEKNKLKEEDNVAEIDIFEKKNDDVSCDQNFKFSKIKVESKDEPLTETSYSSSLDDSGTAQLCIVEKSENTQISQAEGNAAVLSDNYSKEKDKTIDATSGGNEEKVNESIENCSNASRHKKHSKHKKSEKNKNREKVRDTDKEKVRTHEKNRHRSKKSPSVSVSRHSSSSSKNYHTSSSKHTSSCNKISDSSNKDPSISSSQHKSKHSSRSKSRDESKKSSRDSDKKSSTSRDRSSQKKSDRKSSSQNDDHYASKDKFHWRKSTDSNDDDKKPDSVREKTNKSVSNESNTSSGESKSKQKTGSSTTMSSSSVSSNAAKCTDESQLNTINHDIVNVDNNETENGRRKIVILNEILENPMTDFVELSIASKETQMHVVHSEDRIGENESSPNDSTDDLCFFNHNSDQFTDRLKLIDSAMDSCRKVVNSLRFDNAQKSDAGFSSDVPQIPVSPSRTIASGSKREFNNETRATLHIDCIQYNKTNDLDDSEGEIESKRCKYVTSASTLVSPSLSETSVNSKENEFLPDDIAAETSAGRCKKSVVSEKKNTTVNKMSQQRYSSDDLYKPRPVLGQRSRRRGYFDTVV